MIFLSNRIADIGNNIDFLEIDRLKMKCEEDKLKNLGQRKLMLMGIDLLVLVVSCVISYFLVTFTTNIPMTAKGVFWNASVFIVCNILSLVAWGTYNKIWRYADIGDLIYCVFSVLSGTAVSGVILIVAKQLETVLYPLLSCGISVLAVIGARFLYLYLSEPGDSRMSGVSKQRSMIVGGGHACQSILREMLSIPGCGYLPVCVVDDDREKIGRSIHGIKIYGPTDEIPKLCKELNIEAIFFAIPSCDEEDRKRILHLCSTTGCKVKILPYLHKLIFEKELLSQAQDIRIEDLLGREPMQFDNVQVANLISGSVCMVTGGGGSIGSELCRQIVQYQPKKLVLIDIYENNAYSIQQELLRKYGNTLPLEVRIASVRDYPKMDKLFEEYRPDLVFHAAAHKHVPLMEEDPDEAVKNNIFGTFNVASLANKYKVKKFVLVSTDKAVNPTNVMGATKRCCEMIVQYNAEISKGTEFVAVRFGNVLGSNGSVIPLFRKQIEEGGPVTVTHPDIIRYFMTIPEAVSLILQAGAMAKGGEIFVLDMGEPVKITTLAENLIRLYGKEPYKDIEIKFTGLRPGEKLFEELLMNEEGLKSTLNHKIFIGKQIHVNIEEFDEMLARLHDMLERGDTYLLLCCLQKLVPTFSCSRLSK